MRIFEECPYITPCGFCSRQYKQCTNNKRKPFSPRVDLNKQIDLQKEAIAIAFCGEEKQEDKQ